VVIYVCGGVNLQIEREAMTTALTFEPEAVPLQMGADGVVRASAVPVSLESIVTGFNQGLMIDELFERDRAVPFADLYAIIGYYLRHSLEIDSYLAAQRGEAGESPGERQHLGFAVGALPEPRQVDADLSVGVLHDGFRHAQVQPQVR